MRTFLIVLFILLFTALVVGLYLQMSLTDEKTGNLLIGGSLVIGFFVWMPLFLYHRSKKRNMKDYLLTKENLDKMRKKGQEKF
ncbi:hypothetical protein [Mesonia sp. K7]|uniref:hypothetical protein n=1 Tax=Mesonia sp. K7 TaxID=2218606 RepID=UPI000DA94F61|nr:hypothetical protein [Mesonia sp. K7]PZD78465.1 hypothetical protein DNG35_05225 [Mesonia sp. K7]